MPQSRNTFAAIKEWLPIIQFVGGGLVFLAQALVIQRFNSIENSLNVIRADMQVVREKQIWNESKLEAIAKSMDAHERRIENLERERAEK